MTTAQARTIRAGDTLVYDDGRTPATATVLEVDAHGVYAQFEDRAAPSYITFNGAGWLQFLTIQD